METLSNEIADRALLGDALDCNTIWDLAQDIKIKRMNKAMTFLLLMRAQKTAHKLLEQEVEKPSRQWVNGILNIVDAKLIKPRLMDGNRMQSEHARQFSLF